MTSNLAWLLVLISWNVLCENAGQKPPQGFRYASYEVIIPRKLTPRYGEQDTHDVTYLLQIEGKGHVVTLRKKKSVVPKHFTVITYSKDGERQVDYPFIKDDCFYRGFVQDKPSSRVTLSTCSGGLRGLLHLENYTFEIEPVQAPGTFQHVLYRLEGIEGAVRMRCGLTKEKERRQEAMFQNKRKVLTESAARGAWLPHTRYLEVAIVIEHERYVRFDRNESRVARQVMDIIHTANSLYEPLSLELSIAGLEIWTEKNLIEIVNSIDDTHSTFTHFLKNSLSKRIHLDAAHLFIYKSYGSTLGLAYVGTVCSPHWASGVESYVTPSLFLISHTFSHELGHNLGMQHDEKYCTCNQSSCIMAAYQTTSDKFSNCSYKEYFNRRNKQCLLIPPDSTKIYKFAYCGNEVVEDGEECDCGSPDQCKLDPCCQSNCMLSPSAACAFGQCCVECQYLPVHKVCREQVSSCDLPEYCNGTSEWCPEDVYVQDGAPCSDGAYCYHGNCTTHNGQCRMIFGNKATSASKDCFSEMNARGDRFGNCGLRHDTYKKCDTPNILCGRIQCENVDTVPSLEEHSTIINTPLGNRHCWSTDYHAGMEIPDIGAVRDGTPCGTEMMCINRECKNVSLLKYDCNVTKCHNRGICNTYKHCHCDDGWAPPDCLNQGNGGSIDSGPPPPGNTSKRSVNMTGIIAAIVFLVSTIFAVLGLGIYFRKRLRERFGKKPEKTYEEGVKEEENPGPTESEN
ncbi:disintegrin and metalloproteinase domain-containing protein 20-like [Podarcis raffonei]|uniref:disintegrin and metalloproteinase domain-containing protein 20-like n=1 Tax=Podarcis raffonei TaxID=65483 RepID=UPI002329405A|nr:disintegrin and metalloproteinase domain-containing protein 20-like [Podarcis raffonei]